MEMQRSRGDEMGGDVSRTFVVPLSIHVDLTRQAAEADGIDGRDAREHYGTKVVGEASEQAMMVLSPGSGEKNGKLFLFPENATIATSSDSKSHKIMAPPTRAQPFPDFKRDPSIVDRRGTDNQPLPSMDEVVKWDPRRTADWLESMDVNPRLTALLFERGVGGRELLMLDDEALRRIGVSQFALRDIVLDVVELRLLQGCLLSPKPNDIASLESVIDKASPSTITDTTANRAMALQNSYYNIPEVYGNFQPLTFPQSLEPQCHIDLDTCQVGGDKKTYQTIAEQLCSRHDECIGYLCWDPRTDFPQCWVFRAGTTFREPNESLDANGKPFGDQYAMMKGGQNVYITRWKGLPSTTVITTFVGTRPPPSPTPKPVDPSPSPPADPKPSANPSPVTSDDASTTTSVTSSVASTTSFNSLQTAMSTASSFITGSATASSGVALATPVVSSPTTSSDADGGSGGGAVPLGAIVAAIVGVLVVAVVIVGLVVWRRWRRRNDNEGIQKRADGWFAGPVREHVNVWNRDGGDQRRGAEGMEMQGSRGDEMVGDVSRTFGLPLSMHVDLTRQVAEADGIDGRDAREHYGTKVVGEASEQAMMVLSPGSAEKNGKLFLFPENATIATSSDSKSHKIMAPPTRAQPFPDFKRDVSVLDRRGTYTQRLPSVDELGSWNPRRTADWLESMDVNPRLTALLFERGVGGRELLMLDDEALQSIGVSQVVSREIVLHVVGLVRFGEAGRAPPQYSL
ncbi:hypothetical protein HDU97_006615 [Phlyctochytrium planicorne]|nr:hypothetical protein HDU97_006615 [Phlyctochytrium planicorne]